MDVLLGVRPVGLGVDSPPLQLRPYRNSVDVVTERTVPVHLALDGAERIVPDTLNFGDLHLDVDTLAVAALLAVVAMGPLFALGQRKEEVLRATRPHDVVGGDDVDLVRPSGELGNVLLTRGRGGTNHLDLTTVHFGDSLNPLCGTSRCS